MSLTFEIQSFIMQHVKEKAQIKLGYRKYLRIINNRIKTILSKENSEDNSNKNNEPIELIGNEATSYNMDVDTTRILKRKLSNHGNSEVQYDEFSLNSTRKDISNDQ